MHQFQLAAGIAAGAFKGADEFTCGHSCCAIEKAASDEEESTIDFFNGFSPSDKWEVEYFEVDGDTYGHQAMFLRFDMLNLAAEVAESEGL